jgi:hypothetical protein
MAPYRDPHTRGARGFSTELILRFRPRVGPFAHGEKIDQLIDSKRQFSQDLLDCGGEVLLTEMRDDELLKIVALDLHTASEE